MPVLKEQSFADLDLTLSVHPETGKLNVLKNADAIKQSVKVLVLSNFYERVGRSPWLGAHLTYQMFEHITPVSASNIRDYITRVINNYEPRAKLIEVLVTPDHDNNGFHVKITFRPINLTGPVTVTMFLKRVR